MNDCINSLRASDVFSALGTNDGYWQVEIDDKNKDETAIKSDHGHYGLTRVPRCLENAPGISERAMV